MIERGSRVILRTANSARSEIRELLVGVLTAELVDPSRRLWLVSPWLGNVDLLDNRAGAFAGIGPGWGRRQVSLFDVLAELTRRGTEVVVATRAGERIDSVLGALRRTVGEGVGSARLRLVTRPFLHAKGLVGDDYSLTGSMNFTHNGIEQLDEFITFTTNPTEVGALRIEFAREYGGET